jgi:hypothetical protein
MGREKCCRRRKRGSVYWKWKLDQFSVRFRIRRKDRIVIELTDEQRVSFEVAPLTASGRPAPIHGEVVWTVSDPTAVSLVVDPTDSKKGTLTALPGEGVRPWVLTGVFDADLGDGVREITAVGDGLVKDAEAVTAEVTFGTPEQA